MDHCTRQRLCLRGHMRSEQFLCDLKEIKPCSRCGQQAFSCRHHEVSRNGTDVYCSRKCEQLHAASGSGTEGPLAITDQEEFSPAPSTTSAPPSVMEYPDPDGVIDPNPALLRPANLCPCQICFQAEADAFLPQCHHTIACMQCMDREWRVKDNARCPLCRTALKEQPVQSNRGKSIATFVPPLIMPDDMEPGKRAAVERAYQSSHPTVDQRPSRYAGLFSRGGLFTQGSLSGARFWSSDNDTPSNICNSCQMGEWRHGKCTNASCVHHNRIRNRDRRALARTGLFGGSISEAQNADATRVINQLIGHDPIEDADAPITETTTESRSRHRGMGSGDNFRGRFTRFDPARPDATTSTWITANQAFEARLEDPWNEGSDDPMSNSASSSTRTWTCSGCQLSDNVAHHQWCARCWKKRE